MAQVSAQPGDAAHVRNGVDSRIGIAVVEPWKELLPEIFQQTLDETQTLGQIWGAFDRQP